MSGESLLTLTLLYALVYSLALWDLFVKARRQGEELESRLIAWMLIVTVVPFGPLAWLLVGRRREALRPGR